MTLLPSFNVKKTITEKKDISPEELQQLTLDPPKDLKENVQRIHWEIAKIKLSLDIKKVEVD